MNTPLAHAISSPLVVLYVLQGFTYAIAAGLSRHASHNDLRLCYLVSAFLHWGFGACHLMNFG